MRSRAVASVVFAATVGTLMPLIADGQAQADEPWCVASQLRLTVQAEPARAGANQRTASLVLVNTAGESCVLQGFPGVDLGAVGDHGGPASLPRTGQQPHRVTLAPGGRATSTLTYVTGTSTPGEVILTPPDSTTQLRAPWPADLGAITVWPEGATHPGTFVGPLH
ncbi:DUF4232 domain-containing protein [Nocardia sp. NPDC005746]|uniref:DUF4232 domain-containing protein n=1 Tax=Nocardia sp. NPDC005746 TaxID=3157062 RepID=UPI0033E3E4A6